MNTKIPLFFILLCPFIITSVFSTENSQESIPKDSLIEYLNREDALAKDSMTTEKNKDIKQNCRNRSLALFLLKQYLMKENEYLSKECVMQAFKQAANFLDNETRKEMKKSLNKKIAKLT